MWIYGPLYKSQEFGGKAMRLANSEKLRVLACADSWLQRLRWELEDLNLGPSGQSGAGIPVLLLRALPAGGVARQSNPSERGRRELRC